MCPAFPKYRTSKINDHFFLFTLLARNFGVLFPTTPCGAGLELPPLFFNVRKTLNINFFIMFGAKGAINDWVVADGTTGVSVFSPPPDRRPYCVCIEKFTSVGKNKIVVVGCSIEQAGCTKAG